MSKIAYRQKLANLITLLVFIIAAIFFQQSIDSKDGFFLQGYGNWVYYLGGAGFVLIWTALSSAPEKNQYGSDTSYIIYKGVIDEELVKTNRPAFRLLKAFLKVMDTLGLDYKDYTLSMKKVEAVNAYATGLSKGKTVCVFTEAVETSSDFELEGVVAHEMGHTVNKDMTFLAILSGIGCTFGCIGSLIGLWIVYSNWGGWATLLLFMITFVFLPYVRNHASRVTEEFADSYAAIHGYGPGLISFLRKSAPKHNLPIFMRSHPLVAQRETYIGKIIRGDEGSVGNNLERNLFQYGIMAIGAYVSYNLYISTGLLLSSLSFFASVALFITADYLMRGSAGSFQAITNLTKKSKTQLTAWGCVKVIYSILLLIALYLAGLWACFYFMGIISASMIVPTVAKFMFFIWLGKPVVSVLGYFYDHFHALSDIATYCAVITSLIMIASFFVII